MVGDFIHAIVRDVAHGNTMHAGGFHIDRIKADTAADNYFAVRGLGDNVRRQSDFVKKDDGIGIVEFSPQGLIVVGLQTMNLRQAIEFLLLDVWRRSKVIGDEDLMQNLEVFFKPCPHFVMVARHHESQSIRF